MRRDFNWEIRAVENGFTLYYPKYVKERESFLGSTKLFEDFSKLLDFLKTNKVDVIRQQYENEEIEDKRWAYCQKED